MKSTQPLTDKVVETNPSRAVALFLNYENAVKSILRLGDSSATLGMECFNATTIYKICEHLPYSIQYQTYGLEEVGRVKLKKTIEMVTKARTIADKRATDEYNFSSESTLATSKANITQTMHEVVASATTSQT